MPETAFFHEGMLVAVLTTEPLGRALDYRAPPGGCFVGAFVEVPLGPRRVMGVVWGPGEGGFDPAKIRPVGRVLDAAPMGDAMRAFLMRAADYTLTPMPAMLRLATRAPGLADPPGPRRVYRRGRGEPDRMTDARARVMDVLDEDMATRPSTWASLPLWRGFRQAGQGACQTGPWPRRTRRATCPIRVLTRACPARRLPRIRPRRPSGCAPPWHPPAMAPRF